jgi:aldehyde dehydrogenase (NAD+)
VEYTRIITEFHTQRLINLLDDNSHGGKIILGGKHDLKNRYIEPTIIMNPKKNCQLMKEEIFGPILPILTFTDI